MNAHLLDQSNTHFLAVDFNHGNLFCIKCRDYVWDIDFDRVFAGEKVRMDALVSKIKDASVKRSKTVEWLPTLEEATKIQKFSAPMKICTGLRGLINMGSTSDVTCLQCRNVTTAKDPILDLSLNIRSGGSTVSKKKGQSGLTPNLSHATLQPDPVGDCTLVECLERNFAAESLTFYQCGNPGCAKGAESVKHVTIKSLPPILSIQLKRFEHSGQGSKIDTHVRVPSELDMTPFTTQSMKARMDVRSQSSDVGVSGSIGSFDNLNDSVPEHKYVLFAVINHQGSLETGHYTAYVKARGDWFLFDDHFISLATQRDVLASKVTTVMVSDNPDFTPNNASNAGCEACANGSCCATHDSPKCTVLGSRPSKDAYVLPLPSANKSPLRVVTSETPAYATLASLEDVEKMLRRRTESLLKPQVRPTFLHLTRSRSSSLKPIATQQWDSKSVPEHAIPTRGRQNSLESGAAVDPRSNNDDRQLKLSRHTMSTSFLPPLKISETDYLLHDSARPVRLNMLNSLTARNSRKVHPLVATVLKHEDSKDFDGELAGLNSPLLDCKSLDGLENLDLCSPAKSVIFSTEEHTIPQLKESKAHRKIRKGLKLAIFNLIIKTPKGEKERSESLFETFRSGRIQWGFVCILIGLVQLILAASIEAYLLWSVWQFNLSCWLDLMGGSEFILIYMSLFIFAQFFFVYGLIDAAWNKNSLQMLSWFALNIGIVAYTLDVFFSANILAILLAAAYYAQAAEQDQITALSSQYHFYSPTVLAYLIPASMIPNAKFVVSYTVLMIPSTAISVICSCMYYGVGLYGVRKTNVVVSVIFLVLTVLNFGGVLYSMTLVFSEKDFAIARDEAMLFSFLDIATFVTTIFCMKDYKSGLRTMLDAQKRLALSDSQLSVKLKERMSTALSATMSNPFTIESEDSDPFADNHTQWGAPHVSQAQPAHGISRKQPSAQPYSNESAQAQTLAAREAELAKREAQLNKREEQLVQKEAQLEHIHAPNFPPCKPLVYHDIEAEIPAEGKWLVKRLYYAWIFSVFNYLVNAVTCFLLLINKAESAGANFGASLVMLLAITPVSFVFWYQPLYNGVKRNRSIQFFLFQFNYGFHLGLAGLLAAGIPGWGGAGIIYCISEIGSDVGLGIMCSLCSAGYIWQVVYGLWQVKAVRGYYQSRGMNAEEAKQQAITGVAQSSIGREIVKTAVKSSLP
ncbi:hypothetical protein HDU83_009455 [Entophlyctis luteolus]|nr:hypothetical protein HDU83_009455 [Entophlyctis luteolus]